MIHQHHHRITSAVVLALALAASIAPAASADPQPLAKPEAAIAASGRAPTTVRPNPDQQPSTQTVGSGPCSEVCSGGGYGFGSSSGPEMSGQLPYNPIAGTHQANGLVAATSTPAVVHVTAPGNGFDWADAGVGAGGTLALILIGAGGMLTVSRRRSRSLTPAPRPDPQGQH